MKKLITMLFTMTIVISLTAQNNELNFNKTNNYSKTYTYNSKTTKYYVIAEVVDGDCVQAGKSREECTSLKKIYHYITGEVSFSTSSNEGSGNFYVRIYNETQLRNLTSTYGDGTVEKRIIIE